MASAQESVRAITRVKVESIEEIKQVDKTQLGRAYTIWVHMKDKRQGADAAQSYESDLKPVATFKTVAIYLIISDIGRGLLGAIPAFQETCHLVLRNNHSCGKCNRFRGVQFAEGIKPMWEDATCKDGGKWAVRVPKTHTNKFWEDLLLALIGDQYSDENEINGVLVSLRPHQDTFQIWNKSGKDAAKIGRVKSDLEHILQLSEDMKHEYENFQEAIAKSHEKSEKSEFKRPQKEGSEGWERPGTASRGGRGGRGRGGRGQ